MITKTKLIVLVDGQGARQVVVYVLIVAAVPGARDHTPVTVHRIFYFNYVVFCEPDGSLTAAL